MEKRIFTCDGCGNMREENVLVFPQDWLRVENHLWGSRFRANHAGRREHEHKTGQKHCCSVSCAQAVLVRGFAERVDSFLRELVSKERGEEPSRSS